MSPLSEVFREAYARLDALYLAAVTPAHGVALGPFDDFRRALAQHLAVEEQVLMQALSVKLGAAFEPARRELKARHRGIVTLLVPTPCKEWVADLRELLDHHASCAFEPGGLYPLVDLHLAKDREAVMAKVRSLGRVKLAPFQDGLEVGPLLDALLANVGVT